MRIEKRSHKQKTQASITGMDVLLVVSCEPYPPSLILHELQSQLSHVIYTLPHLYCMGYKCSMVGQRYCCDYSRQHSCCSAHIIALTPPVMKASRNLVRF